MRITLFRFLDNGNESIGLVFINGRFECFSLEDSNNPKEGKPRIPEGSYILSYKKTVTPLTILYKTKYKWFKKHLELKAVKNYSDIYIHIGNDDEDTRGCILIGSSVSTSGSGDVIIEKSEAAYKSFYDRVSKRVEDKNDVIITIIDMDKMYQSSFDEESEIA